MATRSSRGLTALENGGCELMFDSPPSQNWHSDRSGQRPFFEDGFASKGWPYRCVGISNPPDPKTAIFEDGVEKQRLNLPPSRNWQTDRPGNYPLSQTELRATARLTAGSKLATWPIRKRSLLKTGLWSKKLDLPRRRNWHPGRPENGHF